MCFAVAILLITHPRMQPPLLPTEYFLKVEGQ